jgi:hypothetical protein
VGAGRAVGRPLARRRADDDVAAERAQRADSEATVAIKQRQVGNGGLPDGAHFRLGAWKRVRRAVGVQPDDGNELGRRHLRRLRSRPRRAQAGRGSGGGGERARQRETVCDRLPAHAYQQCRLRAADREQPAARSPGVVRVQWPEPAQAW